MDLEFDIKSDEAESALAYAPLHQALTLFDSESLRIISLAEYAELLIANEDSDDFRLDANFVCEGVVFFPGDRLGSRLVRCSPILAVAARVVRDHGQNKEFSPGHEDIERALADSTGFPQRRTRIPTNRLGQEALTVWAFGAGDERRATLFGDFLSNRGIEAMPVWTLEDGFGPTQGPFVRQLWIGGPDGAFCLFPGRVADYDIPVRAIRPCLRA